MSQYVISVGSLKDCLIVHQQTPEMLGNATMQMYQARISDSPYLALVALEYGNPIAFKLGYAKSTHTFYSWLGAVHPAYRGQGIAKSLLHKQEQWVKAQGYRTIEVKTMLRFGAMLKMLRSQGYTQQTPETAINESGKILFVKRLR